jgi:hypothetical protein
MLPRKGAVQCYDPSGQLIVNAPARRAPSRLRILGRVPPLPPAMPVNRAAFAANRWLAQFLPCLIGIDNILALSTPGGPPSGAPGSQGSAGWFHGLAP